MRVSIKSEGDGSADSDSQTDLEHTASTATTLKKAASNTFSHCTTAFFASSSDDSMFGDDDSQVSAMELSSGASDAEAQNAFQHLRNEAVSIWTWKTCGLPISGFFLAFVNAIASGVVYGFFLGYMGLDSYIISSIGALMKLPEVLLLPLGVLNDCLPIFGYSRKPYLALGWLICGSALLVMSLKTLPAPYYCQFPDGTYDWMSPPCNPDIHSQRNWYVFPLFLLIAGAQVGSVAGEGLLLEYSRQEPIERRGQIKAQMTMVTTAGALASSVVIGFLMNSKAYLGTFDWGLSFSGLMTVCLVMVIFVIPISWLCVHEDRKTTRPSSREHMKSSWRLANT